MLIDFSQRSIALLALPFLVLSTAIAQPTVAFAVISLNVLSQSTPVDAARSDLVTQRASTQGVPFTLSQSQNLRYQSSVQRARLRRVQFTPGSDFATIKDSVISGTRNIYLLGAQKGQTMSVRIVSLEDNAVFDVAAPSNKTGQRRMLKQEAVVWTGKLPETGDYQVIVGSTRGNATYRLQVTIR